jgi:Ni/Fe-hydrogenase 1 B-type cytochrome subunit
MSELKTYAVWDAGTRWFHWINVLCILGLAGIGLVILNADNIELPGDGELPLKRVHALIGYVFLLNMLWRFVWGFIGNRYARWGAILPGGKGYFAALTSYVSAFLGGRSHNYLGHNPAGRIGVALLLLCMIVQGATGLVLAGTDVFYPPFGHYFQTWLAAPGIDPSTVLPRSPDMYDPAAFQSWRAFRRPFAEVHEYSFYALAAVVVLHVAAVVITEVREGGGIISAMFTGRKVISGKPLDE